HAIYTLSLHDALPICIHSIMTPRADISWINIEDDINKIRDEIINTPHTFFPICRGALDEIIGVGRARDLIADILTEGRINVKKLDRKSTRLNSSHVKI